MARQIVRSGAEHGKIAEHWGVGNLYSLVQQIKGEDGGGIAR